MQFGREAHCIPVQIAFDSLQYDFSPYILNGLKSHCKDISTRYRRVLEHKYRYLGHLGHFHTASSHAAAVKCRYF